MYFWDYGNAFLLECSRAGADVMRSVRKTQRIAHVNMTLAEREERGERKEERGKRREETEIWRTSRRGDLTAVHANVYRQDGSGRFKYPSYVEDIMGPLCFDLGFGPFRWVCCSGSVDDLITTDKIAAEVRLHLLVVWC